MELSFSWINILILFGAFQAFVFCIVLLFQRNFTAKFLAAFVFVFAFNGLETFNWSSGLNHFFFDVTPFIIIFAGGPALYLYIKSLLSPHIPIYKKEIFGHFSLFLFQLTTRLLLVGNHLLFVYKIVDSETDLINLLSFTWSKAEVMSMLVFSAYVIAAVRLYMKLSSTSTLSPAGKLKNRLEWHWVRSLLIWSGIIACCWWLTLLSPFFLPIETNYYPIELLLVAFTYWLVLNGYHKTKSIRLQKREADYIPVMNSDDAQRHLKSLLSAMESRKLFLDPKLSLSKLSEETKVPIKAISVVLNQHQGSNFNDFVNSYRIREVCSKLSDPTTSERFTISGIAFECGFNSQATFQRVFKNSMGVSPREYLTKNIRQSA
jgi:AraC-like DNA-binding protein